MPDGHATTDRAAVTPERTPWNPKGNPRRHLIQVCFGFLCWRDRAASQLHNMARKGCVG